MAEHKDMESGSQPELEEIPRGQKFFDNIWLWFVLSLLISIVLYNTWGMFELSQVPDLVP